MRQFLQTLQQKLEASMPAIDMARSMICAVPMDAERNETRRAWLDRVASLYRAPAAIVHRIYYRQKKRVDADVLLQMHKQFQQLEEAATRRREGLNELESLARAASAQAGDSPLSQGRLGARQGRSGIPRGGD